MGATLLDAECVINSLYNLDVLKKTQWKRTSLEEKYYTALFYAANSNSTIIFEIEVSNGRHLINLSRVKIIAFRHHISADDIYAKCAVS
jgi:hypothetical protein